MSHLIIIVAMLLYKYMKKGGNMKITDWIQAVSSVIATLATVAALIYDTTHRGR